MNEQKLCVLITILSLCFMQLPAQPPETYDLRDHDLVTSVKAQKGGTCWAHATASSLESDLLRTGAWEAAGETGDPNMAEYHLSWWMGFNTEWNGDFNGGNSDGLGVHDWGDFKMFCSYMSRLEGPIREQDAPGDDNSSYSYDNKPDLFKQSYHRWYVPDINWYFIDGDGPFGNMKYIDSIKNEVINYGVCPTNYLCNGSATQTGTYQNYKTHYQPNSTTSGPNHNIGIIGWDDDATTRYSEKGAWLLKNSWGPSSSSTPYLWISYWDKHCCRHYEESCVSFRGVQPVPYKNVYYHDYHGWRGGLETAKECFNKYIVDNTADEYMIDVSFFTLSVDEEWEIKIYDKFINDELQDELASASGKVWAIGYHTRKLSKPVTLKDGDDFYIYFKVTKGGLAYDRTSSPFNEEGSSKQVRADALVPSKAAEDESYYRTSPTSEWTDLYDYEETIQVDGQSVDCQGSHNFCLKGFTIDTMPVGIGYTPAIPNTPFELYNYPNPFASQTTIHYSVQENSSVSIDIFNARGLKVYTFAKTQRKAGTFKAMWNGVDQFNKQLSSGVYYAMITAKTKHGIMSEKKRMFLVRQDIDYNKKALCFLSKGPFFYVTTQVC